MKLRTHLGDGLIRRKKKWHNRKVYEMRMPHAEVGGRWTLTPQRGALSIAELDLAMPGHIATAASRYFLCLHVFALIHTKDTKAVLYYPGDEDVATLPA
jgi:hypothetical protein